MVMIEGEIRLYSEIIKYCLFNFEDALSDVQFFSKEHFIRVTYKTYLKSNKATCSLKSSKSYVIFELTCQNLQQGIFFFESHL